MFCLSMNQSLPEDFLRSAPVMLTPAGTPVTMNLNCGQPALRKR